MPWTTSGVGKAGQRRWMPLLDAINDTALLSRRYLITELFFLLTRTLLPEQITANRAAMARVYHFKKQLAARLVLLTTLGFDAHPAGNGEQAIAAIAHVKPQIVLMDLNMPVMDGFEAARRVRALPDARHLPLVAYSAQAGDRVEQRIRDAGFDRRLTKPAHVDELLEVFASVGIRAPDRA